MPVNDIIKEADYNSIRNKLVNIIGSGSGSSGWGQTIISSAIAVGNRVTVNEWGNLRFDIINAHRHIFGANPVTVQPAVGNTVRYSNTFVPNTTTDAPVTQYDTYADTIINNRFTVHPSQSATFSWTPASTTWPGIYGSFWNTRLSTTVTATWPSAAAARNFFNSGGEIRFASSRTGGSTTQQCNSWTNLLNSAGTQSFGGNMPGTGTTPANGQNYFRLTSTYQQWYSTSSSTPYGSNSYRILARTPTVANNSSGTAATVEFFIEWIDNYVDPGPPTPDDAIDGTFALAVSHLFSTGVLEPPGAGNFTITQPAIQLGLIVPDNNVPVVPAAPDPPVPFITAITPSSDQKVIFRTQPQTSDNTFSTTFVVSCTNGSGTVVLTGSADPSFNTFTISPSTFFLSSGGSRTVTFSGTGSPTSISAVWRWTATSANGGSFTYSIGRTAAP